jgi:hypothetical protein
MYSSIYDEGFSVMNKPREFWLPLNTLIVNSDSDRPDGLHVIEYSAYNQLKKDNEILIKAFKSMLNFEHHEDCESHLSLDEKDMEDDCDCFLGIAREALRQVGLE